MANTTNFNWETPDDTDLVKDGAAAIRTLGSSIDTSFVDLKGGTTGQVLSKASNTDLDYTWVTTDDANAIQNTIVDAKGDLIAASAADTPARLAVGNNGETIVANSAAATGLSYKEDYAAGKNKVINGDFTINQRAFSSTTTSAQFLFDRWKSGYSGGTSTYSAQTFTPGTAPVAGYEGKNYLRIVTTSQSAASDYVQLSERIEGVRTLAGQTATVSFWAKASSGTPKIGTTFVQLFGSGGSPSSAVVVNGQSATISTSWARYSFTFSVPSISGKTIGTAGDDSVQFEIFVSAGADFATRSGTVGIQNNTFEIWGVQVESGSVATAFQTATGTLQGELAACQRYFQRIGGNKIYEVMGLGYVDSGTETYASRVLGTTMRTTPSATFAAAANFRSNQGGGSVQTGTGIGLDGNASGTTIANFYLQYASGGTTGRGAVIQANNTTSATIDFSAEL
jgi:hypothetical protein